MECKKEKNRENCACTYGCSKSGMCCECVSFHRKRGEIPGCFFSAGAEATYDRSFEAFVKDRAANRR